MAGTTSDECDVVIDIFVIKHQAKFIFPRNIFTANVLKTKKNVKNILKLLICICKKQWKLDF